MFMLISTGITVLLMMCTLWSVITFFFISEEEEVDKMMEQKLKEEEERKRKKEMEERMSLEETKEQVRLYDCCILMLGLFTNGVVIMSQDSWVWPPLYFSLIRLWRWEWSCRVFKRRSISFFCSWRKSYMKKREDDGKNRGTEKRAGKFR